MKLYKVISILCCGGFCSIIAISLFLIRMQNIDIFISHQKPIPILYDLEFRSYLQNMNYTCSNSDYQVSHHPLLENYYCNITIRDRLRPIHELKLATISVQNVINNQSKEILILDCFPKIIHNGSYFTEGPEDLCVDPSQKWPAIILTFAICGCVIGIIVLALISYEIHFRYCRGDWNYEYEDIPA